MWADNHPENIFNMTLAGIANMAQAVSVVKQIPCQQLCSADIAFVIESSEVVGETGWADVGLSFGLLPLAQVGTQVGAGGEPDGGSRERPQDLHQDL